MTWLLAGGAVATVLGAASANQIANEFRAWTPRIVATLIRRAVRKLPEDQRERYQEEWAGHVAETPGEIGKLLLALGLQFASYRMSAELSNRGIKREDIVAVLDRVYGFAVAITIAPLLIFLVIILLVRHPGRVFQRALRRKKDGTLVHTYRLRTVFGGHLSWFGAFLRRSGLDCLPLFVHMAFGARGLRDSRPNVTKRVGLRPRKPI